MTVKTATVEWEIALFYCAPDMETCRAMRMIRAGVGAGGKNDKEGKPVKQRIMVEDLMQLSPEQKERLRDWWKKNWPGDGDKESEHFYRTRPREVTGYYGETYDYDCFYYYEEGDLPLLTVGQCIKLVTEKTGSCIILLVAIDDRVMTRIGRKYLEPMDALWQVVKEVL